MYALLFCCCRRNDNFRKEYADALRRDAGISSNHFIYIAFKQ